MPWNPVWINSSKLAVVWQDQLKGSTRYFFTGRSQIRVLDTSAPGHNLLASSDVLLKGGGHLGFMQAAGVGAGGSPIAVATVRVTSIGRSGTATMLLAAVSPTGAVIKTFATVTRGDRGLQRKALYRALQAVAPTQPAAQLASARPSAGPMMARRPLAHDLTPLARHDDLAASS